MSTQAKAMYVKAPFEIRHAGGLLVPGDLVPEALIKDIPEDALTDEAPPPSEPEAESEEGLTGGAGDTGGTGATGGTGDDEPEGE